MVAIKSSVETYLKAPPKGISAILLFGGDVGLVSERASLCAKAVAAGSNPPGEILRMDDADLETDPDRLVVELGTVPMFGGRKIIRAAQSRRINAAMIKPLIEGSRIEGFLIVEAGNLKTDDAMRKLFESATNAAAIPCYQDEARDLDGLVREVLGAAKIDIEPDAKRLLLQRLGADRALSRAEVDKLALYALGKGKITLDDVEAVVGDASEMAIDKIITAACVGRAADALTECDRAVSAGESTQYVVIAAQRHFQRLHRARMAIDGGASMDDALKSLRPPVFFKQKDAFVAQLNQWSAPKLTRALARIDETQKLSRTGGAYVVLDEASLVQSLLLDIARLAAFKGR